MVTVGDAAAEVSGAAAPPKSQHHEDTAPPVTLAEKVTD